MSHDRVGPEPALDADQRLATAHVGRGAAARFPQLESLLAKSAGPSACSFPRLPRKGVIYYTYETRMRTCTRVDRRGETRAR